MVKLEDDDGNVVFVAPQHVVTLVPVGDGTSVVDVSGEAVAVKGRPDEVHAKLFAPRPLSDGEAARMVLEWAADPRSTWRDELEVLARRALGR